jgi:metal-responsive CopG/Arc/MetJ family transcriptional regulator
MVDIRGNELNPAPKTRIEIWLKNDTLEWFSRQGQAQGIENYHNLIEEALHEYIQYYPDLHKIEKE